ncbi:methylated-DNA--[protein]-cysteine S-methyltransferase [Eubacteriales bacterium DFI.9.88]|nr:methylated-DNA--[protein]-cysteine S-methyltransferase [Eubacteriales bacterium DFI.9.88]
MKHITLYDSPVGILRIVTEDSALTDLALDCDEPPVTGEYSREETPLTRRVRSQLDEYFSGQRTDFDLPLKPNGTEFQKKDWAALQEIPYGQTRTYKDIAEAIGCPKGFRAVGLANNHNPIMIIIPCHRVIGSDGSLTGYAGGTHIKKYLLELEGVKVD